MHVDAVYGEVTVLCLVDGTRVAGYIAIKDMYLRSVEGEEELRMLLIPAMAVDKDYQGLKRGAPARQLIDAAFESLYRRLDDGHVYHGIVCIPHTSPVIDSLLRRLEFGPLGTNSFFWWKAIPPSS